MDDFNLATLSEGQNEWASRLLLILTHPVIEGIMSIYKEAESMCEKNQEEDQVLVTFQTFLSRIPKWNNDIINTETKRIVSSSSCDYLGDLISCVHILNLKALSCIRVGQESKKIDIDIPKLSDFIHKVYIAIARKAYSNVYLFEETAAPLQTQKNRRELELLVQECILNVVRESIPVDEILKAYLSQSTENLSESIPETTSGTTSTQLPAVHSKVNSDDSAVGSTKPGTGVSITHNMAGADSGGQATAPISQVPSLTSKTSAKEAAAPNEEAPIPNQETTGQETALLPVVSSAPSSVQKTDSTPPTSVSFNNIDAAVDETWRESKVHAPKDIPRLEAISEERNIQRKREEEEEDDDSFRLKIGEEVKLDIAAIKSVQPQTLELNIKDV